MSRVLLAAMLVLLLGCPNEQVQPPPPPVPAPPPPTDPAPVVDGDVTVAYENGVRILVKRIDGAELASMQLYIKGGARFRTKDNAGAELLALRVATRGGTEQMSKDAFLKKLSALGSDMGASSTHSFSVVAAKSLTTEFDATFRLLTQAFLTPAMPDSEVELRRQRQIVGIKRRTETADGKLHMAIVKTVYAGHPFENMADGTVETVANFTADALRAHLKTLHQTSRLQLVVVGDIAADRVQGLVRETLGDLPRGEYEGKAFPKPSFTKAKAVLHKETLPTNYIEASFIGPSWGDPDFAAGILAMRILGNRLFEEVRTKRNLSYAPSARYGWSGEVIRGSLYVTATDPNTTIEVMHNEVKRLANTEVGPKLLAGAKSVFVTSHLMANESTNGQASWLAMCDIIGGDWKLSRTLPDKIKAVSAKEVQAFAGKYIRNLQTVVFGDPNVIDQARFESL